MSSSQPELPFPLPRGRKPEPPPPEPPPLPRQPPWWERAWVWLKRAAWRCALFGQWLLANKELVKAGIWAGRVVVFLGLTVAGVSAFQATFFDYRLQLEKVPPKPAEKKTPVPSGDAPDRTLGPWRIERDGPK